MYEIGKTFEFAAAQRLDGMPEGHPCARMHGHTYTAEFVLGAEQLDEHGMVLDYHALAPIKEWIDTNLDHGCLNDRFTFNPTAENLARYLFDEAHHLLTETLPVAELERITLVAVRVCESSRTFAEYRP